MISMSAGLPYPTLAPNPVAAPVTTISFPVEHGNPRGGG